MLNESQTPAALPSLNAIETSVEKAATELKNSISELTNGVRESITAFDKHPLAFVRENPLRATAFGFLIGMVFGSALSKRAVTK